MWRRQVALFHCHSPGAAGPYRSSRFGTHDRVDKFRHHRISGRGRTPATCVRLTTSSAARRRQELCLGLLAGATLVLISEADDCPRPPVPGSAGGRAGRRWADGALHQRSVRGHWAQHGLQVVPRRTRCASLRARVRAFRGKRATSRETQARVNSGISTAWRTPAGKAASCLATSSWT